MKKAICLVMAFLILAVPLCACGEETNDPNRLIGKTIEEVHEELGQPLMIFHSEGQFISKEVYPGTGGKAWTVNYDEYQVVKSVDITNYG